MWLIPWYDAGKSSLSLMTFFFFKENVKALVWLKACLFIYLFIYRFEDIRSESSLLQWVLSHHWGWGGWCKVFMLFPVSNNNKYKFGEMLYSEGCLFFFIGVCASLFICFWGEDSDVGTINYDKMSVVTADDTHMTNTNMCLSFLHPIKRLH